MRGWRTTAKINSIKTELDGYLFDSQTEAAFYEHLKRREDVKEITVHPTFELITEFEVNCGRCHRGKVKSPKTGNMIKCKRCNGTGIIKRQPWSYTPDFLVRWENGEQSFYDVKGGWKDPKFNYVKKMFEWRFRTELLVVKPSKKGWRYM